MTQIRTKTVLFVLILICVHPRLSAADYSKFSHSTPKHQSACNTCHKIAFPDITDYPSHDACVSCHRPQFFRSARPPICSVCHSKTSPRDDVRYAFRNPATKLQFAIEFPHDKHQDVIAMLRFAHPPQGYNNCTICHASRTATFKACAKGSRIVFQLSLEVAGTSRRQLQWLSQARNRHRTCSPSRRGSPRSSYTRVVVRRSSTLRSVRRATSTSRKPHRCAG